MVSSPWSHRPAGGAAGRTCSRQRTRAWRAPSWGVLVVQACRLCSVTSLGVVLWLPSGVLLVVVWHHAMRRLRERKRRKIDDGTMLQSAALNWRAPARDLAGQASQGRPEPGLPL